MLGRQIEYSLLELLGPPAILPQPIGSQIFSCYVAREMPYLFRVSRLRRLCVLSRGTQVIVHRHVHRLNCLYLLQTFEGTHFRNSKICRDRGLMARSVQSAIVLFGNFLRSFESGFHKVVSADIFLFFPKDPRRFRCLASIMPNGVRSRVLREKKLVSFTFPKAHGE